MQTGLARAMTLDEAQALIQSDDELNDAVRAVDALDFTMLKTKLMQERGWTVEFCDEVDDLYRKFLALNKRYPGRKICPTGPVDDFWHAHILDTAAYEADCARLFGGTLHHFPYFGMRGPDDERALAEAFGDSVALFMRHFGIDPTAGDALARKCHPQRCP